MAASLIDKLGCIYNEDTMFGTSWQAEFWLIFPKRSLKIVVGDQQIFWVHWQNGVNVCVPLALPVPFLWPRRLHLRKFVDSGKFRVR
jgi:hypothetical protein